LLDPKTLAELVPGSVAELATSTRYGGTMMDRRIEAGTVVRVAWHISRGAEADAIECTFVEVRGLAGNPADDEPAFDAERFSDPVSVPPSSLVARVLSTPGPITIGHDGTGDALDPLLRALAPGLLS
jgi:hypothetical protein